MRKVLSVLWAIALIGVFLVFPKNQAQASSEVDQQYTGGTSSAAITEDTRTWQSFRPSKSKLDKIEVEVIAQGGTRTINCKIKQYTQEGYQDIADCGSKNQTTGWMTFDFDDINVTIDARYAIALSSSGSGSYPLWKWNSNSGNYSRGYAVYQATDYPNGDFNFKTWGYNPEEENLQSNESSGQSETSSNQSGGSAGTNQIPAATTSAAIKAPSNLKAENAPTDKGGAVKLTWTASQTTNISGYKIFRSDKEKSGFKNIAKTDKKTLTYTDSNVEIGKTYYYFVRAYKDSEESASSNTANITVAEKPTAQTANTDKKTKPKKVTEITEEPGYDYFNLYNIGAFSIVLILLIYLVYSFYRRGKEQRK